MLRPFPTVAFGLAFLLLFPVSLPAQTAEPVAADVHVGFAGQFKVGGWTPVRIDLKEPLAETAVVVVITADFENNRLETPLKRVSPTRVEGMVQVGRLEGTLDVVARDGEDERPLAELRVASDGTANARSFRQNTEFWGVLGSTARFADAADEWTADVRALQERISPAAAVAIPLKWDELPADVEAWDSLDVMVVGGAEFALPADRNEMFRRWTERGGRVLFILGSAASGYRESPLAQWSPIVVEDSLIVPSLDSVKARVSPSAPLLMRLRRGVPAAKLAGPPEGTLPGPAVLSKPYGFGFVTAFAFDFEEAPLSTWQDQTSLLRQLMTPAGSTLQRLTGESDLTSIGVTDLASQLTSGLDRFPQVDRPTFRGMMVWTALWMIVLFPLDYLVVHKFLKRPHLTWLTLPVLIALATFLTARTAMAANSAPLTVNQIDLLDFTPADAGVRVRSWMTFYSGETARYDVAAKSAFGGSALLAWNAKPEEGLRGLYRHGGINFGAPAFRTNADHTAIEDLPVRLWSSYSLNAEWSREKVEGPALVEATLTESDSGRLRGVLKHNFPGAIRDWIVVYKNFVYYPFQQKHDLTDAAWAPGSEWRPDVDGQPTLVHVFLQGHRQSLVRGKGKDAKLDQTSLEVAPYEALEFDPPRLFRMLSFHEKAGGSGYTGLSNYPLAKLDVSRLLDAAVDKGGDSAVLFGRLDGPLMNYEVQGAAVKPAESWTFVRAVLPVE